MKKEEIIKQVLADLESDNPAKEISSFLDDVLTPDLTVDKLSLRVDCDIVKFKYMVDLDNTIDLIGVFTFNSDELRYEINILDNETYDALSYVGNGQMSEFEIIGDVYAREQGV